MKMILPKYVYLDGKFHSDWGLLIDLNGNIQKVGSLEVLQQGLEASCDYLSYPNHALCPGLVNVHSHSFQRVLRGMDSKVDPKQLDSFWTWRKEMYRWVECLDPESIYSVARACFLEMVSTGITSVGEFHYLHHDPKGNPYSNPNELGLQVLRAAEEVGIRICLLDVLYLDGGISKPLNSAQRRFADRSLEDYVKRVDQIQGHLQDGQTWGYAPHSIRAVNPQSLGQLHEVISAKDRPVHMHLHEQPKEIRDCKNQYGKTPIQCVQESGLFSKNFTVIHGTHLDEHDLKVLSKERPTIGACPTTERDLGDGILQAKACIENQIPISLGSDSNILINLWEDSREIEYHLRLQEQKRNITTLEGAKTLMDMATLHGARCLGLSNASLKEKTPADFILVNLEHPNLWGAQPSNLLETMIFSMQPEAVSHTFVQGKCIYDLGHHLLEDEIFEGYQKVLESFSK